MFRSTSRNRRYESWLTALVIPFTLLILAESPLRLTTSGHINRTSPHSGVNGSLDSTSSRSEAATKARLEEAYGKLPLLFGANRGQTDARVKFLARSGAQTLFLTAGEAVLKLRRAKPGQHEPEPYFDSGRMTQRLSMTVVESDVLRMRFVNANPRARIFGVDPATSKSHYLIGNDPREWETNVANYYRVKYEGLYPGVDVVWYGAGRQIEYDLLVKPGARPDRVNLEFPGAGEMALADDGALIVRAGGGQEARLVKPRAWQDVDGERREIDCGYRIGKNRRVAFRIGAYDTHRTLVIDPVLSYSTYLGGVGFDSAYGVAVDGEGNAYVTGATDSADFPGPSQIQQTRGASTDVFVAKLDPTGRALVWGTWLGGGGQDLGAGVAVDAVGAVYVAGYTSSNNFPLRNALQTTRKGPYDAFVSKLNPSGSALIYSTLLGGAGSDFANSLAVDANGHAYVAGSADSFDFPTQNPVQPDKQGSALYLSGDAGLSWTGASLKAEDKSLSALNVYDIAIDPTNSQTIYAATDRGVYKSENGGAAWGQVSGTQTPVNATQVLVDPQQPVNVYALIVPAVYKSPDAGKTWTRLSYPGFASRIAIAGSSPVTLYGYDFQGFNRSRDGGLTWTPMNVAPFQNGVQGEAIVVDPLTPSTVYIGATRGLFKSADGGSTWSQIGAGIPMSSVPNFAELAISRSDPQTLYAVQRVSGLFKSVNGGGNFQPAKLPPNVPPYLVQELTVDPADPNTIYLSAQQSGLYKSSDGGETWRAVSGGLATNNVYSLAIPKDAPTKLYAGGYVGTDAFVAKLDPAGSALVYSTYLGGKANDSATRMAIDAAGAVFLAGSTASTDFPVASAYQPNLAGPEDVFVAKLNPSGSALSWATFLGGGDIDRATGLAVDASGGVFIAGYTYSQNFPTVRAIQTTKKSAAGQTGFVTRFNPDGQQLAYSTYLGGSGVDAVNAVAVDPGGNAYVTGYTTSRDFPTARAVQAKRGGRFETDSNAFVTVFNSSGSGIVYSTYLGGDGGDFGQAIAVDARGSAYVVGSANSRNFPTTPDSLRPTGGSSDAFVSKLALNADLALGLSDLPDPLQSGGAVSYLITVTNNGPDVAEGVRLGYTLPAGTEVSRATTQGDCAAATCDLGSLAVGGRATVTIVFKPNQTGPGSFRATATASATTPDLNPNNNSAEQETRFSTLPSIYGRVTTADGAGLGNVAVALGGAQRPGATTSGDGIYQFAELPAGAGYNLTPSRAGYVFNPPSRAIDNLQTDQRADFAAVACRFTIGPTTLSLPSTGGTATVAITSPDSQCEWTARSNLPWIKFNNAAADGTVTGRGNGSVTLTVAPTVGSRSGALTIAGATLTVRQEFNACSRPEFINPPVFWINNLAGDFGQPSLIVRDINGDGIDDVFLLTRKDNLSGVSVMIGKAGGGFEAPVMLLSEVESETQKINSFDLKDVNADGKPDLIAVYRASNGRVIVAFGDGRGGFGAPASYAAGQFPGDAAIADFNSDGKPDIALLGFNNNPPLSILLNNGDGTFGAAAPVNTSGMLSTSGFRIGVSDFNQDGKADLAILIESSAFVVLLGDGAGRFTPQTPISAIFTSQSFAIGDFNGDGKSDVVIAGDGIQFLAGRGDGSFDTPVIYPYGNSRTFIVAEDFTGDGRKDLVVPSGSQLRYITATGDGRFNPPIDYFPGVLTGEFRHTMAVGDYNRDGRPDLYFLGTATGTGPAGLVVMTSDSGGGFAAARSYPYQTDNDDFALNFPARSFTTGDLNGDGLTDMVIARGRHRVEVLLGQGRGRFGAPTGYDVGENPQYPIIRDLNNDGKPDVVVSNRESKNISILLGDGAGGLGAARQIAVGDIPVRDAPNSYAVGDFNGDGKLDLIVKGMTNGLALLAGDGNGNFGETSTGIAADYPNPQFVAGDFDGDGALDLVVIPLAPADDCFTPVKPPALLLGDGRGGFRTPLTLDLDGRPLRLFVADLNNDKRDDLLFTDTCVENAGLKVMLARGDGGFTAPVRVSDRGGIIIQPFVGDVNGDGWPDILENATGGMVPRLLLGNGDGTFGEPFDLPQSRDAGVATIGDFDQDGSPDLAFLGFEVIVMLNRGGCFAPGTLVTTSAASYDRFTLASESIAALFGAGLASTTQVATTIPLPTTLANASVKLRDSGGSDRAAPLFFVSPNQINLQIPAQTAPGVASITAFNGASAIATGVLNVAPLSPALFTADSSGLGLAAAVALRARADGTQSYEPVARLDASNRLTAAPVDLGVEGDRVFLLLFGSGMRKRGAPAQVKAQIGGVDAEVFYVGPQGDLVGLDQINLLIPRSLIGRGDVEITLTVDGRAANPVRVTIK